MSSTAAYGFTAYSTRLYKYIVGAGTRRRCRVVAGLFGGRAPRKGPKSCIDRFQDLVRICPIRSVPVRSAPEGRFLVACGLGPVGLGDRLKQSGARRTRASGGLSLVEGVVPQAPRCACSCEGCTWAAAMGLAVVACAWGVGGRPGGARVMGTRRRASRNGARPRTTADM